MTENNEARIGVFVCHCGHNIAGTVDVKEVAEMASKLPGVIFSTDEMFMCSDAGQVLIKEKIAEVKDLRRDLGKKAPDNLSDSEGEMLQDALEAFDKAHKRAKNVKGNKLFEAFNSSDELAKTFQKRKEAVRAVKELGSGPTKAQVKKKYRRIREEGGKSDQGVCRQPNLQKDKETCQ